MFDSHELVDVVKTVLTALGYKNFDETDRRFFWELSFQSPCNLGFDGFKNSHKDAIRMLLKGYLREFSYSNDTHYIQISKELKGLEPEDDRYSCLYDNTNHVMDDKKGKDVFINYGDFVERYVR